MLQLTANSGAALGITTGLQFLPFLLLGPFSGLVADRMPKRLLLQITNVGMAIPAPVPGLLAVTGTAQIWHVYVPAFVLGLASAFDAPARQSFVSEIVDPEDLTNAVGLNSASFNAARLVGPGAAGLLIAAFGGGVVATGWVILINAVSYIAPVLTLRRMDPSRLDSPALTHRGPGAIREGFAYVRARSDLLLILAIVFSAGTFGLNFQMTSALMATEVFHKGPTQYGLLGTFPAVGSLSGALLAAGRERVRQRLVIVAGLVFGGVVTLSGLMPSYLTFALLTPLIGLSALTLITSANAYMQLHTEPGVRGRVMALYMMIFMGGTPVGAPMIGWIGEAFGARWTLIPGGLLTIAGISLASLLFAGSKGVTLAQLHPQQVPQESAA
ncbi:MFS transporter [Nocardioides sp. B-3]|uniref:MFS transporter n=1 Tax=Nocardioides sp. B-3 TaxID=2895565 RepID=UPI00215315C6|nr:MFS transporter [Nocardioides sp. B-3]UUZ57822.1 MFS transporter [Nocardioides sp. B-3]